MGKDDVEFEIVFLVLGFQEVLGSNTGLPPCWARTPPTSYIPNPGKAIFAGRSLKSELMGNTGCGSSNLILISISITITSFV